MKKLFVAVLAIAGLVACNNENVVREQNHSQAIDFGVSVDNATRSGDPSTTTNTIEDFSVWAYMNQFDGYVFNNELVSRSGGAWTYVHTQYWLPGNEYYFAAFAGKRNADGTFADVVGIPNAMAADGLGVLEFTNTDGTNDILYAEDYVEVANPLTQVEKVDLNFAHLLSKVKFSFINGFVNDNNTIVVKDIKMVAPKTATVDLTADPIAWNGYVDTVELDFGDMNGAQKLADGKSAASDNELLTIPAPATQDYTITFKVTLYNGEQAGIKERLMTVNLSGLKFEAGRAYNLVATINQENLDLNAIEFVVEVDEWDEAANVDYGYDVATNSVHVQTPEGLLAAAEDIANATIPSDATIVLEQDIDLSTFTRSVVSNWTPIGTDEKPFTGTFDGNGHTIKNLTLVEPEAKEGKAYIGFFGYAKDATIKNVTFENVYINIPCLDIDHSQGHIGAVAGSLEGTSTIENVTVKGDIQVYATQEANGASRVAVVAGGNSYGDVTMRNVHVIANEGSYLIANNNTGALAGQLQGKALFENCSSNIDVTVNKFFAGGLIGIAAGDQTFINCHTTGDVAVVAGREGRHNDEYRVGGIAGGWADGKTKVCTLVNCSYTGKVSGMNSDGAVAEPLDYMGYVGRGYTLANCAGSKVIIDDVEYVQLFDNIYGVYTVNGAYAVNSAADLKALANLVNAGTSFEGVEVVLTADIDLKNENWTPIGSITNERGFCGNFDGRNHTIKNLTITNPALDADNYAYAGLFGITENNTIKNLTIENVNISTEGHIVAAAIAYPYYTDVENITVKGNISINGGNYTSGILAYTRRCVNANNLTIEGNERSSIKGNITIGGVISDIQMNGGLTANYSNFAASGLTIEAVRNVGGISGIISEQTLNGATVKNVTIVCSDTRVGIVAGADGGKSTVTNVSYENVTGATRIIGATYDTGNYVGQIVEVGGQKAVVFSVEDGVKAVSVEELNLNGKSATDAATWAEGLGEGWSLASIYDLDAIHAARFALNDALEADNADNALFCETDYLADGKYAIYISSTEATGNDPQGEAYFSNRVHVKYFNINGYWDYAYSTFATINKNAPLKGNHFARGVYKL